MSLWPTPGRLTSRVWPLMALVSSFAIQGRVSASSDPLMIHGIGELVFWGVAVPVAVRCPG